METGIIIFFNSESHSFFVDAETSLSSLKEHVVQSFGLDKDAQLVLKTLDESLTLSSDEDLRTVCSQVDADDFVLLSTFVVDPSSSPSPSPSDPVSVEASSSSLNIEAEEPKKDQEESLEFPAFIQDVMRQMKVDPQVTKKKAEKAFNKINAKCPGLITPDSVRHINGFLNQLSSNLEKQKTEINDFANSLDRSSFSSSSSCEGAIPPFFHPFFRRHHREAMKRCRKNRKDHAEEPKSAEPQMPSPSRSDRQMHLAMCDNCSTMIEGVRFKCTICPDFDLCAKCEDSDTKHNPDHLFVKMKRPIDDIHFNNHLKQTNASSDPPAFPQCPNFERRGGHCGRNDQAGPFFFGRFPPCHPGFGPGFGFGPESRPFCPRDAPGAGPRGSWHERKHLHERVETLEKTLASLEAKLDRLL